MRRIITTIGLAAIPVIVGLKNSIISPEYRAIFRTIYPFPIIRTSVPLGSQPGPVGNRIIIIT